jgi:hypothetical protein
MLAVADQSWSADLEVAISDLAETMRADIVVTAQAWLAGQVNAGLFPVIPSFKRSRRAFGGALSHKYCFSVWFRIAVQQLNCAESSQFLTMIVEGDPKVCAFVSTAILQSRISERKRVSQSEPQSCSASPPRLPTSDISQKIEEFTTLFRAAAVTDFNLLTDLFAFLHSLEASLLTHPHDHPHNGQPSCQEYDVDFAETPSRSLV